MLISAPDPYLTEANAVKAEFNSQLDGSISISYQLTYPFEMIKQHKRRSDDNDLDDTDDFDWSPAFACKKK